MAFLPSPPPPPVGSDGYDKWLATFWQQTTKHGYWTPDFTFATPGTFAHTFSLQKGDFAVSPNGWVVANFTLVCLTFAIGTAAGAMSITGLPFTTASDNTGMQWTGSVFLQGITKAGYTAFTPRILSGATTFDIVACGSGVSAGSLVAADFNGLASTGFIGNITFRI
jgi:hypothetical protein